MEHDEARADERIQLCLSEGYGSLLFQIARSGSLYANIPTLLFAPLDARRLGPGPR